MDRATSFEYSQRRFVGEDREEGKYEVGMKKFIPKKGIHYFKDEDKKYAISNASVESGNYCGFYYGMDIIELKIKGKEARKEILK